MALTPRQVAYIVANPLRSKLNDARALLLETGQMPPSAETIQRMILTLLGSSALAKFPMLGGPHRLAHGIVSLYAAMQDNDTSASDFNHLSRLIVDRASECRIWEEMVAVVENKVPIPFLKDVIKGLRTYDLRPAREPALIDTIGYDYRFKGVDGFWEKFFDTATWTDKQLDMAKALERSHNGREWEGYRGASEAGLTCDWLYTWLESVLTDMQDGGEAAPDGEDRQGEPSDYALFCFDRYGPTAGHRHCSEVLVVGLVHGGIRSTTGYDTGISVLTHGAHKIFESQPARQLVHVFNLDGDMMELWVFDRAGAATLSSGRFDVHSEWQKFARAMVGYMTLSHDRFEMGTFTQQRGTPWHDAITAINGLHKDVALATPLVSQLVFVSLEAVCLRAGTKYRVKFRWGESSWPREVDHLLHAQFVGVEGVVRYVGHRQITTISELYKGLNHADYRFRDLRPRKVDTSITPSGGYRSENAQVSTLGSEKQLSCGPASEEESDPREDYRPDRAVRNKRYSCLVVAPAGRPISEYETIQELLYSLRDAIRAHRSLYIKGGILHRAISEETVIITDPDIAGGYRGMLTDLGLASSTQSTWNPKRRRRNPCTRAFEACRMLSSDDKHEYWHDLESFMWLLLWLCGYRAWQTDLAMGSKTPPDFPYRQDLFLLWWSEERIMAYHHKERAMWGLHSLLDYFPDAFDCVKPLCYRLSELVAPNSGLLIDPDHGPDISYQAVIRAFDDAIGFLEEDGM